jgi:hypothetical protein
MTQTTAAAIVEVFQRTYRIDPSGEFVNKIGEPAPGRSIDLMLEATALLADAE